MEAASPPRDAPFAECPEPATDAMLFLHAPAALAELEPGSGRLRRANAAWAALLDVEGAWLEGHPLGEMVPAEARPALDRELATLETTPDGRRSLETRLVRGDGELLDTRLDLALLRDGRGRACAVLVTAHDITVQHAVEQALRDTADRHATLLERIGDAFFALDRRWRFTYVNRRAEQLLERRREALLGRPLPEALPEVIDTVFWDQYQLAVATGEPHAFEAYYAPRDTWFEVRADPSPDGLAVYFTDISHRVVSENALRESEERLRLALELTSTGVWDWDLAAGRVTWSDANARIFGVAPGAFRGTYESFAERVHPDDLPHVSAAARAALESGEPFRVDFRGFGPGDAPRVFRARGEVVRDADGTPLRMLGVTADITEIRRDEDRLRRSLALARAGTWEWDIVRDALLLSEGHEALYGLPPGALHSFEDFIATVHPEDRDRVLLAARSALREGEGYESEFRTIWPDGTVRWLRSQGRVTRDARGRAVFMSGAIIDVTEARRTEEQLRRAERLQAVGTLAGGMAHEVNNMMTAVIGFGTFVRDALPPGEAIREDVDELLRAAGRAATITRQVLAFSRQQVLQPTVLDLNAVVREMAPVLARLVGAHVRIEQRLESPLARVRADRGQLEQVLVNLAANARDAMPAGGRLTLATAMRTLDESWLRLRGTTELIPGRYVLLTVTDTGTGMAADTRLRAFEPFFTTKPVGHGTGLGLAMVHGVVSQSGGDVWLYSEPGHGTVVKLVLPAVPADDEDTVTLEPHGGAGRGSECVLVVDDEPVIRRMARRSLEEAGYRVLVAQDGREALEVMASADPPPDLVLCDVIMPGLTGREVGRRIAERWPGVPVLYMSGYTGEDVRQRGLLGPGDLVVSKPFTPNELARLVRDRLDARLA